jgi:predicted DNA-binding transcriptional regulator AlpA
MHSPPRSARAPGRQPEGLGMSDAGGRQNGGSLAQPAPEGYASGPLLLGAADAAALCGLPLRTWWRLHATGRAPAPLKCGRRTLWRAADLRAWVVAGCPSRDGAR